MILLSLLLQRSFGTASIQCVPYRNSIHPCPRRPLSATAILLRNRPIFFYGLFFWGWLIGHLWAMGAESVAFFAEPETSPHQKTPNLPDGWAETLFDRKRYDFGRVPAGTHAEFAFVITNPYPFEVEISRIRKTCDCTEPILAQTVLAPGEQTTLTVRLQTERFKGRKGATCTVTFIRPEFAEVQLHITAYLDPTVSLEPAELDFGSLEPGRPTQKEVDIICRGRPNWRIESVGSASSPALTAKIWEVHRNADQVRYRLHVHLKAEGPLGPFREVLFLKTNDPQTKDLFLLVTGHIRAEVEVHPPVVWLGTTEPNGTLAKSIVLQAKRPFAIQAVTSSLSGLTVDIPRASESQTVHRGTVRYQAETGSGKLVGTVRIRTTLTEHPLEIPVHVRVLPGKGSPP